MSFLLRFEYTDRKTPCASLRGHRAACKDGKGLAAELYRQTERFCTPTIQIGYTDKAVLLMIIINLDSLTSYNAVMRSAGELRTIQHWFTGRISCENTLPFETAS